MMTTINSLYELFGLSPDCTDDELREAYRRAILQHHPDVNPDQVKTATATTQQLTVAYANLKEYHKYGAKIKNFDHEDGRIVASETVFVSFSFEFNEVDIENIAYRKSSFREAWEAFRQNSTDVLHALRFVHAAFNANREDAISDLLQNPILIDAASMLLSLVESESACETLIKWENILYENQLVKESIQILEDAFSTGKANFKVVEKLRSMHYSFAQGYLPLYASGEKRGKPAPDIRIEHLSRILELGFEYGYIHKLLAEAYHELGDDTQARTHLTRAYEIDPQLIGAVRISRALGFIPAKKPASSKEKKRAKYKYTRPEQIPSPSQIRKWAASGDWNEIFAFADLTKYSPRILPKSRSTIRQIASSLDGCSDTRSKKALECLLDSFYWEVREASIVSLSKIGDKHTLHLLKNLPPDNSRLEECRQQAVSYLKSRVEKQSLIETDITTTELIKRAKQAFAKRDFGQTRFLLESIVTTIEKNDPQYFDMIILLARTCAEMEDPNKAINLIKPIFAKLPIKTRYEISKELAVWLWDHLVFDPYDPVDDEDYLLALDILLKRALTSNKPDEVLENLRYLMGWLELVGENEVAQWLITLVRTEAPGTWYADSLKSGYYHRRIEASEYMKAQLTTIRDRIKTEIPNKLSQVLKSPKTFKDFPHRLSI
jgi:curved DNA-binding protein CbpA